MADARCSILDPRSLMSDKSRMSPGATAPSSLAAPPSRRHRAPGACFPTLPGGTRPPSQPTAEGGRRGSQEGPRARPGSGFAGFEDPSDGGPQPQEPGQQAAEAHGPAGDLVV